MIKTIKNVEKDIRQHIAEARQLLPTLPADLTFVYNKNLIVPGNGTGGTLLKPTVLGIGYDPTFENVELLAKNLRATVLHECYHAVQGWSDIDSIITLSDLLDDAVLEGAATVFERDYGGTKPPWALYEDDATMAEWLSDVKLQKMDVNSKEYNQYKFGTVNGVSWMLYKLGTWLTDRALSRNSELDVTDLATKNAAEIIDLAGV